MPSLNRSNIHQWLYHSSWLCYLLCLLMPIDGRWGLGLGFLLFSTFGLLATDLAQLSSLGALYLSLPLFNLPYWYSLYCKARVTRTTVWLLLAGVLLATPLSFGFGASPLLLWQIALLCMALAIWQRTRSST